MVQLHIIKDCIRWIWRAGGPWHVTLNASLCAHDWRGFAEGVLKFVFFKVLWFKWLMKKQCVAKILQGVWERFLYENNPNYNSYKISCKLASTHCLSFRINQKQESSFHQVAWSVRKKLFFFLSFFFAFNELHSPSIALKFKQTFIKEEFSHVLFLAVSCNDLLFQSNFSWLWSKTLISIRVDIIYKKPVSAAKKNMTSKDHAFGNTIIIEKTFPTMF